MGQSFPASYPTQGRHWDGKAHSSPGAAGTLKLGAAVGLGAVSHTHGLIPAVPYVCVRVYGCGCRRESGIVNAIVLLLSAFIIINTGSLGTLQGFR